MIDSWLKAVNDGKLTGCVMVDFRKGFDLAHHKILLNKLKCYNCDENCLSWYESYLSNRTQRVILNNDLSPQLVSSVAFPKVPFYALYFFNLYK